MRKCLVIVLLLFTLSCDDKPEDSLKNTFFKRKNSPGFLTTVKVSKKNIADYLALRPNFGDTTGRRREIIDILKSAFYTYSDDKSATVENALKAGEENFRIRHQVDNVLVIKSERALYLFKKNNIVQSFHISLGPHPIGQKVQEGDGRTPEGIYILDGQRFSDQTVYSYHISYPNRLDSKRAAEKGVYAGSNIMVHGTSKGKKKKDWTNGCIGLSNEDMDKFRKLVFQGTQIEIRK